MIPSRKPLSISRLLVAALAIALIGFFVVPSLFAVPGGIPMTNSAPPTATNGASTITNADSDSTNSPPAATNAPAPTSMASSTNAAPGATSAAPASATTAATGTQTEEAPAGPGEMSGTATPEPPEPIGPPAPGGDVSGQIMPYQTSNPAVTDITNNPDAAAGLGRRHLPFYFGLDVGEMYDDNVLIAPSNKKEGSFITHISPSIDYQLGDISAVHANYLNLYFSPTVYIYENRSHLDRTDYNADAYYQYTWTRLQLGIEQNYQHLTDASLDEGTLVSSNIYTTKATASYAYNDDLSLYETATQQLNNYPGIRINEWDADTFALYQIAPKLQIGAGPRLAYISISDAPDNTHEDLLFRLRYVPDERFTVSFDGGVEYLQFREGQGADKIVPIFDGNATYALFEDTSIFASAGRTELNSYDLNGDLFDYTTINAGISQKFLQNFTATGLAGYALSQYGNTEINDSGSPRRDNYFYGKASVEWNPNQWLKVEASYQYSKDNSTDGQFSFTDNQIDLQSSVKF